MRKILSHYLPILPTLAVVSVRLFAGFLASRPIPGAAAPALVWDAKFIISTLVWAMLSVTTSIGMRLFIDRRILFTAGIAARPTGGGKVTIHAKLFYFEATMSCLIFVALLLGSVADVVRPGTLLFAGYYPLGFLYGMLFVYLTLGLIGRLMFPNW